MSVSAVPDGRSFSVFFGGGQTAADGWPESTDEILIIMSILLILSKKDSTSLQSACVALSAHTFQMNPKKVNRARGGCPAFLMARAKVGTSREPGRLFGGGLLRASGTSTAKGRLRKQRNDCNKKAAYMRRSFGINSGIFLGCATKTSLQKTSCN